MVSSARIGEVLNVGSDETLAVQICNVGNLDVDTYAVSLGSSLVPTVVGDIGARSQVRVDVIHSANVRASGEVVVGMKIDEHELTDDAPDASLMSEIIKGTIGESAEVSVNIRDSANVELVASAELWIGKGTLLQEVINVESSQRVRDVCFEVDLDTVANVEQVSVNGAVGSKVYIRDGQLDDETIDLPGSTDNDDDEEEGAAPAPPTAPPTVPAGSIRPSTDGSTFLIRKNNVANVIGHGTDHVWELRIWDGELSDETMDVGELTNSYVDFKLHNVGNAQADYMRIVDGESYPLSFCSPFSAPAPVSVLSLFPLPHNPPTVPLVACLAAMYVLVHG